MALGRGNIEIDVRARGLTQDVVRQVQDAERRIRPLSVTLDDKGFRQPLGRITGDLAEFQKSLDASVARTLAFGAAVGVLNAVTNGFKAMISSAVEVEKSLTDVNVILNLNAKALENFSSQLFNTAKNTGQSFQTVSEAAVELSRQGLGAEETLKRINDAMILTRLSGMDAAKSVETLTAAINGFGSAALTTTELVNKLATVDAAFAVSTEDLSNALARAGSTAQGAKVSLDELLAAVTSVQQQTARGGSVIGNAFKSIFTRIQRSGVREALEEIGVATQDSTGNIRGALDILKDYARVYGTLSDAQRAYTDELVAGVFQINNLKALVKDLGSDYSIYQRALSQSNNATDEAVKRNQELQGTLAALINEASVNAKELASSLGELVATPAVENLLKLFNNLAGALNEALDPDKGSALIKGMFSAIGTFISGPGLVLIGAAFIKLFKFITSQSLQAVKEVFKIGDASNRIADTQAKITFLLKDNQALYQAISNEALTHEQREEVVLQTIKSQNAAYAQQQAMIDRLARSRTIGAAIGGGGKNKASGYIPNFANGLSGAINAEKQAVSLGTGGASKSAKPKVLKSFPMGRGKRETIVANTDEVIVPNYGGGSGSAIFNQDMIKKAGGVPQGAIPVSQGYIPNFAKGKRGIDKGGKSIKDSKIWRNATDGYPNLFVDAESLGGFGMISIKGNSGRFNQQKKLNPFGSSYLGTEKGKEIIDEIAGSRLTAQDKQIVLSKIQRLGGGVLGVSFQNMGGATFSELNGARASDFAGEKGIFNDIIGGSIAQATADISARIYGRLFGDEVKANQLVSSVVKEADRSKIVSVDAEGSIFEAAIRLGSKASAKTFGTNSGRGAWDFEETSNISPDLKEMFFDSVGYSKILRADAKRVGSPETEKEVIDKAYRTPFFRDALEQIHKQQYTPLVQKAIQAKNDTSKAQGYIPNFAIENVPTSQLTRYTRKKYSPKDIRKFGNFSEKNKQKFRQEVPEQSLLSYLLGKLRNKDWRSFISDNFIKKTTAWSKTNYTGINEQDFSSRAKTFNIKGGKSAYIYTRGSELSQWSAKIGTLLGGKKENKKIGGSLNSGIKQGWYRFDRVSIPKPDQSKSKINYRNLRQRIDESLDKKIKGNTGISLNSLLGIGPEIFPQTNASIDDAWRGRYQKILKSNRGYYTNRIKDYNKQFPNDPKGSREKKQHQARVTGRIFEELLASAQKAVTGETSYLSKLDTANWDFYNLTQEEKELLGVTANFGDYKTTLDNKGNKNSFINKFIRQPNGADGFIPSFAGLSQLEHFQKYSYGRHGKTLDLQQFFPKSGTAAIGNLFKDVIDKAKAGDPYEKIVAGEIVGPRIPKMILRAKKTLDRARASGLEQPKMRIEGRFDPGDLMGTLANNKGLYKREEKTARILGKKFEPSKRGTGIKKKSLASKYVPGETAELTRTLKEMGVPGPYDKPGRTFYLPDLPIFSKGFAEGFIPNFANSLEEAIVREKDALASQRSNAKIYVDQDNRLRDPKNPMGLLVANTRDEPLSGSQGVNRAISSGINPKNKGAIDQMAGGYVPNFNIFKQGLGLLGKGSKSGLVIKGGDESAKSLSKLSSSLKKLRESSNKATAANNKARQSANLNTAATRESAKAAKGATKELSPLMESIKNIGIGMASSVGLSYAMEALGKSFDGLNAASTALYLPISGLKKAFALAAGGIYDFSGELLELTGLGMNTERLISSFEKYGESIDNQINKIEQNIEKVDKFAATLSSLNKAAGSKDIEAYGKFLQQTLDQASELEGLDVDLVQNLISSTGNVEEFNAAIEELKRSTEQAKGIKTFSKDITELSKRVLEAGSFIEAGISEDEIRSLGKSLTKNLNTDQIDDFAKSLQGIGGLDSEQAKEKLLGLQSVIGEFDDVTKEAINSGGTLAQELLKVAKGQIEYKKATQDVIDSYKNQLKPVKNLASSIKQLALAAENATRASTAAYKALSETAKIQAGSRVERLKATGTVSEGDVLRGQASADLIKVSQDSSQEINTALRGFVKEILKQGKDGDLVLKGTTKDIIDNLSKGDLSTQDALNSLITLQADAKSFEKENQELISKTISSIQGASNAATIERRKIQATLAAQLAAQENAAIALNRNVSVTEQQLDVLSGLGKGDSKSLQAIDRQTSAIEALINRGSDPKLLNPLLEELKQQRQTLNLKEQFRALAAGTGAKFDAEGLVTLERQVNDFIDSDSFGKLSQVNQQAIIASKKQIDLAKQAQREGGVKGVGDVAKAADTLISQASIGQLSKELSKVMSDSLAKGLNIDDATLAKLNETFSDIPSLVNVISQTSAQNAEAIENNNEIEKKLNDALIGSIDVSAGKQLDAAGKLENAATALQNAAASIQQNNASGFVPNFAPNPVSRALKTESKMGAKRPVLDSHPSIGAYVRDGATQANFAAVKRDHPEGLRKAAKNSKSIQSAMNAKGFVPNFADLDGFKSANLPRSMVARMGQIDKQGVKQFIEWAEVNRPQWTPYEAAKYYVNQAKMREGFAAGGTAVKTLNLFGGVGEAGIELSKSPRKLLEGYFFGELNGLDVPGGFPRSKARKVLNNFNLPNNAQSIMGSRLMNLHETGVTSTEEELNDIILEKFVSSLADSQNILNQDVKQNLFNFLTGGEGAARLSAYDPLIGGTGVAGATFDTGLALFSLGRGKAFSKAVQKIKDAKNAFAKIYRSVALADTSLGIVGYTGLSNIDSPVGGFSNVMLAESKLGPEFQNIIDDTSEWIDAGGLFQSIIPRAYKDSMFDGKIEDIVMDPNKWYPEIKKGRETDYSIKDLISEKIFDNLRKKQGVELKSFDYAGAKKDTSLFLEKETIRHLDKTNIGSHLIKNIKGFPNGKAGSDRISEFFPRFSSQYLSAKGLYDFNEGIKQGKPYPFPAALEFVGQKELSNVPKSYTEGDIDSFLQRLYQNEEIFNDQKNELHKGNRGEDKKKQLDQLLGLTQSGIQRALSFKQVIKGHKETESFSLSGDSFVTNPFYYNQDSILGNLPTKIHLYKTDPVLKKMEQLGEFPDGRVTLPGSTNQINSFSNRYPPFIESLKSSVLGYNNQVDILGKNAFPEVGQSLKSLFEIDPSSGGRQALESIEKALEEEKRARFFKAKPGDKDAIKEALLGQDVLLEEARVAAEEGRGIFDKGDVRGEANRGKLEALLVQELEQEEQNVKSLRDKKYKAILGSIDQASMINPDRKTLEAAINGAKEKLRSVPEIISNRKRVEESWLKGDPPGLDPRRQNRIGLYSQLQAAKERGQDTTGLSKRIAGHEQAIKFFDSELAKYGNPDDADIATLLFTDTSAANAVRVGPNNRLLKGFYNRPNEADALKKLLGLKKKYKIGEDDALKAVIGEGEITNPFEYLTQVAGWTRLSNDEKELDTLYAKMRQGGGILNGQIFKKEFEQANQQQRIATMMKLGIRSTNKISKLPGDAFGAKDLGLSISNLKEVFSKSSADAPILFLLEELSLMSKNIKGGLEEGILSKQIKDLNLPFVDGEQARTALQKKMTKVFLDLGREGQFEERQVKALEDNGVRDAIDFITRTQLDSNLKELSKRDGDFNGIESALLTTHGLESKEKLMQTPLYLKFLKDKFNAGRVADSKINGYLTEPRNVPNYEAFKALYANATDAKSLFKHAIANTDYGKVEYTGNVDNNPFALNERGNNPFAQLMGQARIDTEEKMLDFFFEKAGGNLYFGRNQKLEEFIYNNYNPFKKLPVKDWKERSLDAAFELFGERRKLAGKNFENYAPFGYDIKSKFKTFYPPWAADTSLITRMFKLVQDYGPDGQFNAAKGFIPNFSKVAGEISASRMAGYKSPVTASQVKSINIPGVGQSTFNTQESVFKASGMSQPFIVPPANSKAAKPYAKQVQRKFNFNPYGKRASADGFIPNFAPNGNGFDFSEMQQSIRLFEEATLLFSKQSEVLRSSANSFQESANKISELQNQEPVNFERLTSAASKIEISFDKLSSDLSQPLEINSSSIETSMDNLATALSNMQASMTVSIPDVNVNINGAAQITDSISSLLQAQIPQLVQNEISKMNLATKFDIGMN